MKKRMQGLFFSLIAFFSVSSYGETLLIGDSLMGTISESYKKINNSESINIHFIVGSGLENKKYDWFNYVKNTNLSKFDKIIISFGTNDFGISNESLYAKKVKYFIKLIKDKNKNVEIIWVGPPVVKNQNINAGINKVRHIIYKITKEDNIKFTDVRKSIGYDFVQYNKNEKIRTNDGIHYTLLAGDLIVKQINLTAQE